MAVSLTALERRRRYLGYALVIDGLEVEWDTLGGSHTATLSRSAVGGLDTISPSASRLDPTTGLTSGGDVTVTVAGTRTSQTSLLARATLRGAARRAQLAVALGDNGALGATVEVVDDISGWPATGVLWVGQEAMAYSARTVVAPFQFTVNAGSRGYYGSPVQAHRVSVDGTSAWVTDSCVSWRGRPAALRVAVVTQDSTGAWSWGDVVDEVAGYLDGTPERGSDGSYELTIVPWSTALAREVGGEYAETHMTTGWHVLDGEMGYRFQLRHWWPRANCVDLTLGAASAAAVVQVAHLVLQNWSDPTLGGEYEQGRQGPLVFAFAAGRYFEANPPVRVGAGQTNAAGNTTTLTAAPATFAGDRLQNDYCYDLVEVDIGTPGTASVIRWPIDAITTINAAMAAASPAGAAGRWVSARINLQSAQAGGHAALEAWQTFAGAAGPCMVSWGESQAGAFLWWPLSMANPDEAGALVPIPRQGGEQQGFVRGMAWKQRDMPISAREDDDADPDTHRIIDPPSAYYQAGEQYLLVDDDVFPDPPFQIDVTYKSYAGNDVRVILGVSAKVAASTITAGAPGVALTLDQDSRYLTGISIGAWGDEVPIVRPRLGWTRSDPREVLLEVLTSPSGGGAYATQPGGANVPSSRVDQPSFLRYPLPSGAAGEWSQDIIERTSVRDIVEPILRMLGAAIVDRLDPESGLRRLTLVSAGIPQEGSEDATIADGDWLLDGAPAIGWDERLTTTLRVSIGELEPGGDPAWSITLREAGLLSAYEEQAGRDVELRGVRIYDGSPASHLAVALPIFARETALRGEPRLMVRGSIPASDALRIHAGAVVVITAAELPGYDGSAISGLTGRVMSVNRDHDAADATVEVTVWPYRSKGIAPALAVTALPAADQVTVDLSTYQPATHPVTGAAQDDTSPFAVGDVLQAYYSWGTLAASGLTIQSIVGATITFTGAHGLGAATAYLVADTYDSTTAAMRAYAYQADDAGTLGAAADPADDYS